MSISGFSAAAINFGLNVAAVGVTLPLQIDGGLVSNSLTNIADGTAAAPSYSFTGDNDTGFYRVSANTLGISTAGVQRVVVDSAGNVGVGGTPVSPLDVQKNSAATNPAADNTFPSWTSGLTLRNTSTTNYCYSALTFLTGNAAGTNQGFSIVGQSTPSGFASSLIFMARTASGTTSEYMRLDADGRLGIGITPTEKLHVSNGVIEAQRDTGTGNATYFRLHHAGNVYVSHNISSNTSYDIVNNSNGVRLAINGSSWGAISDERKKKNIKPLEYGLAQVAALKPVRFDYKTEESDDSVRIGFIAQELLPVIKEAVQGSEDTEYSVTPTDLIPVLVKAIQELSAKNEALEARLAALESK